MPDQTPDRANLDIINLLNDHVLGEGGWTEFKQAMRSQGVAAPVVVETGYARTIGEAHQRGIKWSARDIKEHKKGTDGEDDEFVRYLAIHALGPQSRFDEDSTFKISLETGEITAEVRGKKPERFNRKSPRENFVEGLHLIFGEEIEAVWSL